jgi:hypothetical protein
MNTMTDEMRQMLVDAAAAIEDLTDLAPNDDGSDECLAEREAAVRLAGRLRDAAAGCEPAAKPTRTWDVWIDTAVTVEMPADIDPDTDEGYATIHAAAAGKFIDNIENDAFDIRCEEYRGE